MSISRGRFPARLTLPELDPAVLEQYRLYWRGEALYHTPERFPPLHATTLFGVDLPLSIDIGCATGEFVCALAAAHPKRMFLGVEMARKPIEHAVARAAKLGLENIRFLQADMTLAASLLQPNSVELIAIHFPVPFTTTHKRKHLTYGPRMLQIYKHALVSNGRISVVTDDPQVAADVQQFMAEAPLRPIPQAEWQLALEEHMKSPYQQLWQKRKRTIWRAEYAKP